MAVQTRRVALVTGASSGIGEAAARELAAAGFTVYGTSRKAAAGEQRGGVVFLPLDVTDDGQIARVFDEVDRAFGGLDFLVHGAAYAPREELSNPFSQTSREGFRVALDVSAYSLIALARGAEPLMTRRGGGSIVTLTYLGSERVFPNYNVMGVAKAALEATVRYLAADLGPDNVRVNLLSLGPLRTMSARGIRGFMAMMHESEKVARDGRSLDGRRRLSCDRHVTHAVLAGLAVLKSSGAGRRAVCCWR